MRPKVPSDWELRSLGSIVDVLLSSVDKKTRAGETAVRLCNYMDVYNKSKITSARDLMQATATDREIAKFGLRSDDVMITKDSEDFRDIAVPSFVESEFDTQVVCGYHLALLRPKRVEGEYLAWALRSKPVNDQFARRAHGTTRFGLTKSVIRKALIPVPPSAEQQGIATILSSVNDAIAATRKVIEQTERVKKGLLQTLMTRGIGHTRFKQTEIGEIPEEWEVVRLDSIAHIQTGVAKNSRLTGSVAELPYLRVANVQDGYLDLGEVKTIRIPEGKVDRYLLEPGDVLLTEGGDFDKLGRGHIWRGEIEKCVHQNHVFVVRPDQERLTSEFLNRLTSSPYAKRYFLSCAKQTTNLASINSTQLRQFPVALPPLAEQQRIASVFKKVEEAQAHHRETEARLDRLKRGLLQDLLTGRVRVPMD